MPINRQKLISKYNVKNPCVDCYSPISVGNGDFTYTVDITGLQTLYKEYEEVMPLCTMSNFGWNTIPEGGRTYTLDDLKMNAYTYQNRQVVYPKSSIPGEKNIYDWLRINPHRFNLFRLGLKYKNKNIKKELITDIDQELNLYEELISSQYRIKNIPCRVETVCDNQDNILGISLHSQLLMKKELSLSLEFPYGSEGISGSVWDAEEAHESKIEKLKDQTYLITRQLDQMEYQVLVCLEHGKLTQRGPHRFDLTSDEEYLNVTIYTKEKVNKKNTKTFDEIKSRCAKDWKDFWENTGIIDFTGSTDKRAFELERRIILSLYLLRIQCTGSLPPAETGLTCNSWYGKFHLEMHIWHCAYLPLYHQGSLLKKSLNWYKEHLKEARDNAGRNQFKGARWPKMVAYDGVDSPSPIAPLLIWQQPHILYMLEILYQAEKDRELLEEYWEVVKETADFMADFAVYNDEKHYYELLPPLIPVQECHAPENSKNPAFELEYWHEGLKIAVLWAERTGRKADETWKQVMENMAPLPEKDGIYLAHENAPDTYMKYQIDHPAMLMCYGLLEGDMVNRKHMKNTLNKVLDTWDFDTVWGWDFAVMAMTAARLNEPELAVDLLLKHTQKNQYNKNGHNRQGYRTDLPIYLPGNGSLLLAVAAMAAGYKGTKAILPGFPKEGWKVCLENIEQLPC